jgi:hypothetical protein
MTKSTLPFAVRGCGIETSTPGVLTPVLFGWLHKALTKIGNSCSCGSNIRREVQPPADLAINVHGVVHIVACSLPPVDLGHDRAQRGLQQLQAFLSCKWDFRKIPVKLSGIQKPMPSRLIGDWRRRSEYVSVIDGGGDYGPLQLCANGVYDERQKRNDRQENEPPSVFAHPEIIHSSVPAITFGANIIHHQPIMIVFGVRRRAASDITEVGDTPGSLLQHCAKVNSGHLITLSKISGWAARKSNTVWEA